MTDEEAIKLIKWMVEAKEDFGWDADIRKDIAALQRAIEALSE